MVVRRPPVHAPRMEIALVIVGVVLAALADASPVLGHRSDGADVRLDDMEGRSASEVVS